MDHLSFLHLAAIVFAWMGACAGHAVILVASLNWWYSVPLHRSVLSLLKKLHVLAILAGPVARQVLQADADVGEPVDRLI